MRTTYDDKTNFLLSSIKHAKLFQPVQNKIENGDIESMSKQRLQFIVIEIKISKLI